LLFLCTNGIVPCPCELIDRKTRKEREWGDMRRSRYVWLLLALVALIGGCNREDSERLARVGKRGAHRLEKLTEHMRQQLQSSLPVDGLSLHELRLAARVNARLRWEKGLEGATIEARAIGNEVELRGTIQEEGQRQRAVELAESTVGVEKARDKLEVMSQ
jgi:hypothetical protein